MLRPPLGLPLVITVGSKRVALVSGEWRPQWAAAALLEMCFNPFRRYLRQVYTGAGWVGRARSEDSLTSQDFPSVSRLFSDLVSLLLTEFQNGHHLRS